MIKNLIFTIFIFFLVTTSSYSENIKKIEVNGNKRISNETILLFGEVENNTDVSDQKLNNILKKLYETNFFKDINIKIKDNVLIINVQENPIIQSVEINGIKAKKISDPIRESLKLKKNKSYIEYLAKKDKEKVINTLRNSGYYFAELKLDIVENSNNSVTLIYNVDLGKKAKIRKIKFIGDKKYKDRKLYSVIVSEENKFWKFLSRNKLLNQSRINLDERLLGNFYKNKGYYKVKIQSSFAQFLDEGKFDLIFNINAGKKFFFNELNLVLPTDYDRINFSNIDSIFAKIKNKPYSFNHIEKILDQIELIALSKEYESINAEVEEKIVSDNKLNFSIYINESEKSYVERINFLGNNITREEVLRNNLIIDEGDTFNELLHAKSVNNLKALNFFKSVNSEVVSGSSKNSKIINFEVEEKPTGEISAGAGFGTTGTSFGFGIKENNFLGKGIEFGSNLEISDESVRGMFQVVNPNFRNSDQVLIAGLQSSETDRINNFGYKTTKTGFNLGTRFEYYDDFYLSPKFTTYYESLKTSSSASTILKKQKGTYFDIDFDYSIDYDKRNQKFQPTDGFRSTFDQSIPLVSDTNALMNAYEFNSYHELMDGMVGSFSFYSKAINSISSDDVRISERLYLPGHKLRGFQVGKVGPVDSDDYVGGNYVSALNFAATLPNVAPNVQNLDFSVFYDAGNVWGVDYSSSVDESNKIRSSAGLAMDWHTPVGPLSFSYAGVITKDSTDKTQAFRFNLGTTF